MAVIIPGSIPAVSLFGSPLDTVQVANTITSSTASLASGVSTTVSGLQPASGAVAFDGVGSIGGISAPQVPFADLLTESVNKVEQYESQVRSAVEGLMSGRGVDIHEAMIATEKAEMGFELMLAVRNKALAAYQQVMGLQF